VWIHIFCWGRACVYIFYEQATRRQKAKTDGWQDAAIAARIRLKMPTDKKPWVPFCRNVNFLGGPRELDCQDVAYWKMKKDVTKAGQSVDMTDWWCDYSQSSHRGRGARMGRLRFFPRRCFTATSTMLHGANRFIYGSLVGQKQSESWVVIPKSRSSTVWLQMAGRFLSCRLWP